MIKAIRDRLFSVRFPYSNMIERQQARVLLSFTWSAVIGVILWTSFIIIPALTTNTRPIGPEDLIVLIGLPILYFIFRYVQRGQLNRAAWITVILLLVGSVETARDGVGGTKIVLYLLPIVVAGLLLQRRGILTVFITVAVVMAAGVVIQSRSDTVVEITPAAELGTDFAYATAGLIGISLLLFAFSGVAERITLEQTTILSQMDKISTLFNSIALDTDERAVLNRVVTLIHEYFALGAARIYLTDMVGNLVISSGGEFGQPELSSDEVISLTDTNIISEAARMHQIRTIRRRERLDVRSHRMRPNSNIAIALPIMTEDDRVLGVIDLQSIRTQAFDTDEINILQNIANQLAGLLTRMRVHMAQHLKIDDQKAVLDRLQKRVNEYEERDRRSGSAWSSYLHERGASLIGFDLTENQNMTLIPATDLPETLRPALEKGELVIETVGGDQVVNVPIRFRDTTLGAMSFVISADHPVSNRQIEIARTVAQRLALALENARLFEQSQSQAQREHAASEFTRLLTGATNIKTALNLAAENFNSALGAIHTRIYLQPEVLVEPVQHEDTLS